LSSVRYGISVGTLGDSGQIENGAALCISSVDFHFTTFYRSIRKYAKNMEPYLDQLQPQVSDTWRADELFPKVKGNTKYVYALLDDETRIWIAQ
jgi:hypothetical protein